MAAGPRVLYHATGGGLGHGMRVLALARQLSRRLGGRHVIVVNTPFAAALTEVARREPGVELIVAGGDWDRLVALLWQQVCLCPDLWVIDTLPRGVVGELVPLLEGWSGCPRVLIARPLKPAYVREYDIAAWVQCHYDLVLVPGERGPLAELDRALLLPPFLIRDREELPSCEEALDLVQAHEPVVLVAGSGSEEECRQWCVEGGRMAANWPSGAPPLRVAVPPGVAVEARLLIRHMPLIECMPAVRLLVGSAGYHLVHEARFAGVPGLFRPRRRQYDDQAGRLLAGEVAGADLPAQALECLSRPAPARTETVNGAALAAERIADVLLRVNRRRRTPDRT
jgi:hypothetical protein